MTLAELVGQFLSSGIPITVVRRDGDVVSVEYSDNATDEQKALGQTYVAAWSPPTLEEEAQFTAAALVGSNDPSRVLLRTLLKLIMSKIQEHRNYLALIKAQIESLGGTLPPAPDANTWDQLVEMVKTIIRSGAGIYLPPLPPPPSPTPPPNPMP